MQVTAEKDEIWLFLNDYNVFKNMDSKLSELDVILKAMLLSKRELERTELVRK